jgi:hypothetical protein
MTRDHPRISFIGSNRIMLCDRQIQYVLSERMLDRVPWEGGAAMLRE